MKKAIALMMLVVALGLTGCKKADNKPDATPAPPVKNGDMPADTTATPPADAPK